MTKPAWDHLYSSRRWRALRKKILARDSFTCQMCGRLSASGMVVDHKTAHKGDLQLFWDVENLQVLCASPCHNLVKQSQEKGGNKKAPPIIGLDGWPI